MNCRLNKVNQKVTQSVIIFKVLITSWFLLFILNIHLNVTIVDAYNMLRILEKEI